MLHHFDTEVAKEYGVPCAVVFAYIADRCAPDCEQATFSDGQWWFAASAEELAKGLTYMSVDGIRKCLAKLRAAGLLKFQFMACVMTPYASKRSYAVGDNGLRYIERGDAE